MATWAERNDATRPVSWTKRPQSLSAEVDLLERAAATDLVLARIMMRLYWNRPLTTRSLPAMVNDADVSRFATAANRIANQSTFNLMRDLVDGAAARVCRQMSCKVVTVGGDAQLSQQAAKLSRLIDGLNNECKTRELGESAFIDACTCRGFGAVKVYFDSAAKELKLDRPDPMGVFFRTGEGNKPQQMFTRSAVSREYLQDTYPKKADALAKVSRWHRPPIIGVESNGVSYEDTVKVDEGWKLSRGDEKGRWVMTCGNIVLENEPYPYDFHQVILVRMLPEFRGAGGVSLARIAAAHHRWMNQLVRIAHDSLRGAVPRVVHDSMTTINQGALSDTPYAEFIFDGPNKPEVQVGDMVSPQLLAYIPQIRQQAHIDTGVNEAMSSGLKPAGLNSGEALIQWRQFADARLNGPNERWSDMWCDIGKALVGIGADHYKDISVTVQAPGAQFLSEIRWKEIDLKKAKHRVQFLPSSALSSDIAGRTQEVQNLQGLGQIDAIEVTRLVANVVPDVAAIADRVTAGRDLAIKMCEDAMDGIPQFPSSNYGQEFLNDVQRIGTQMMCRAQFNGNRTPEQMECMRKLVRAAKRKTAPPTPAMLPAPIPAPQLPAMAPGAIIPVGVAPQPAPAAA